MIQNFRGKPIKDTEAAADSMIDRATFQSTTRNNQSKRVETNIVKQQNADENFDNFIEKEIES